MTPAISVAPYRFLFDVKRRLVDSKLCVLCMDLCLSSTICRWRRANAGYRLTRVWSFSALFILHVLVLAFSLRLSGASS